MLHAAFFGAAFLVAFFAAFLAPFFTVAVRAAFLATTLRAAVFLLAFFAEDFFAEDFFAAAFFAGFLAGVFAILSALSIHFYAAASAPGPPRAVLKNRHRREDRARSPAPSAGTDDRGVLLSGEFAGKLNTQGSPA